ncbi:hypothetical protein B0H10DRAFT_2075393, partial [Mycena sp. CBHHK59/15]
MRTRPGARATSKTRSTGDVQNPKSRKIRPRGTVHSRRAEREATPRGDGAQWPAPYRHPEVTERDGPHCIHFGAVSHETGARAPPRNHDVRPPLPAPCSPRLTRATVISQRVRVLHDAD